MKNKILLYFLPVLLLSVIWAACEFGTGTDGGSDNDPINEGGTATISGVVIDSVSGEPLFNAVIRAISDTLDFGTTSTSNGSFSLEVTVDKGTEFMVVIFKEGYTPDTTTIFAAKDRVIDLLTIKLFNENQGNITSGTAASISLFSQPQQSIGVVGSGSSETAKIVFVVLDSSGTPINLSNAVTVNFRIGSGPGGGEFIEPASVKTNADGQATVNVNSGTIAGVLQLVAEITTSTRTITSKPVTIAIHGGLPDAAHFSVVPDVLNVPGGVLYGVEDVITAFVGDKYGNPVRTGTPVYFTTEGGIIGGSAITDELGRASVTLVTALPFPVHPTLGEGFANVTAKTTDETLTEITTDTRVLFSSASQISCSPTTFNIPNGGSETFSYIVSDQYGNPLVGGTTISVSAEGTDVELKGDVTITLPDTQSDSWTFFQFTIGDANADTSIFTDVQVKIESSGPNLGRKLQFSGVKR